MVDHAAHGAVDSHTARRSSAGRRSRVHNLLSSHQAGFAPLQTAPVHPLLRARAEQQLGLFTAVDARRAGYEHAEIRTLCTSGRWVRVRRGVYTTPHVLVDASTGRHATGSTASPYCSTSPGPPRR